jgi:hypothetical protein
MRSALRRVGASAPHYDERTVSCHLRTTSRIKGTFQRAQNAEWACILIVIEARIGDALSGHPQGLPVNELSKIVNIEAGKLARILRLLATRNCFIEGVSLCLLQADTHVIHGTVDTNVFANNRLSLTLHSSNPVRDLAHCHVTLTPKAATVLYQNLTELPYGPSYEFRMAPFMHAVQDEGIIGGFFDWLQAHVRIPFFLNYTIR